MFARVLLALCLMAPVSSLFAERDRLDEVSFVPLLVLEASVERVDSVDRTVLLDGVWYRWPDEDAREQYAKSAPVVAVEADQALSFDQLRAGMRVIAVVEPADQMAGAGESRVSLPVVVEVSRGQ